MGRIKAGLTTTAKTPDKVQVRDTFQTPRYATELLIPFIPVKVGTIWECACGGSRMITPLIEAGYSVIGSDITDHPLCNFLSMVPNFEFDCIITNPPFSVKEGFIEKAFEYGVPFAFLINADYSGQTIDWIRRGCQKIVPTSRISYLTPNVLQRIHQGELIKLLPTLSKEEYCDGDPREKYKDYHNYNTIDDVPNELLYKYSSAQFHSMWLTYGFDLPSTETFVDLPIKARKENIK